MDRYDVFMLVDGERDYQNKLPLHSQAQDASASVADWLIFIEQHLANAKAHVYALNRVNALKEVRKVAALAVACMEHNETPPR